MSEEMLGERKLRAKLKSPGRREATYVELPSDCVLTRLNIPDALIGRAIDSLDIQEEFGLRIMFLIRSDEEGKEARTMPKPQDLLLAGSSFIVIGPEAGVAEFQERFG
jgi:uncharacterized protein with PhoU and TrkA domain